MNTQISLKLPDTVFQEVKKHSEKFGYATIQEFIRETIREKLYGDEELQAKLTMLASQQALAKHWMHPDEDKAWEHLQKEQ